MKTGSFVSNPSDARFPFVSSAYEGTGGFVSISFPARFASFPVSPPIDAKRETNAAGTLIKRIGRGVTLSDNSADTPNPTLEVGP